MKITHQFAGSSFVIVSAAIFSTYGLWSRLMADGFGEFNQAWTRALMLLPVLVVVGILTKQFSAIAWIDLKWFIFIGLLGALNQAPYYLAFQDLPVGTATLLFYLGLVIGGYGAGRVFFAEKFGRIKITAFVCGLLGLFVVFGFDIGLANVWPASLSLLAGIMGATAVSLTKKLSGHYSELQVICSYLVFMLPLNWLFSVISHESLPSLATIGVWLSAIGYTISFALANLLVIAGFKYLEPSVGSIIGLLEVPFAMILGILFFNETITIGLIVGSSLILVAAALPNLSKK